MRLTSVFVRKKRVYVDAKVLGIHDPNLQRFAYVCYVVEGSPLRSARPSKATETDDAEIDAIIFAIGDLKTKLKRFIVVCDHQSVVSEAMKFDEISKNFLLNELRKTLADNWSVIELTALKSNPAHGYLTEFVNKQRLMKDASS